MSDHQGAVPRYGQPVTGKDFFYRQIELAKVITAIQHNNSFFLFGLRRIGKSSILLQAQKELLKQPDNRPIVLLDAQPYDDPAQLFTALLSGLPQDLRTRWLNFATDAQTLPTKLLNGLKETISGGKGFGVGIELREGVISYWRSLATAYENFVVSIPEADRPFLVIDELPFFFENLLEKMPENRQMIAEILSMLRSWRNAGIGMGLS